MAKPETEALKERLEFSEHKRLQLQKRLSKISVEEDSTLWSFVDLMTLLLILFILFYSHAMTHKDSEKYMTSKNPQTPEAQSFEVHKTSMAVEPVAYEPDRKEVEVIETRVENPDETLEQFEDPVLLTVSEKVKRDVSIDPAQKEADAIETETENPDEALEQFEEQVLQSVSEKVKKDFSIRWNQKRLVLVLGERVAFNVGKAALLPDFQPTLKQIAEFISSQKAYKITVAGHTDDTPINNSQFPSNWELSAIRAVNVAKFMIANGVDPHRIATEGYSAYRPLQPNTSDDNKQANRRVEITLIKAEENEKPTEEKIAISTPDASMKPKQAAGLRVYHQKKYRTSRGYPF
jgi:chemotaxis protein MotB